MPPTAIPYAIPTRWIHYDATAIVQNFVDAKAAVLSLRATPHQRDWVDSCRATYSERALAVSALRRQRNLRFQQESGVRRLRPALHILGRNKLESSGRNHAAARSRVSLDCGVGYWPDVLSLQCRGLRYF